MPNLIYALRFRGDVTPAGIDGNVLRIAMTAPGCAIRPRIGSSGLAGLCLQPARGGAARCESEVIRTGASTFQEVGTIVFGSGRHRLQFSTVGSGWIGPGPAPRSHLGGAIWRIDGGEGQFAGASGLIANVFRMGEVGQIETTQVWTINIPDVGGDSGDAGTDSSA